MSTSTSPWLGLMSYEEKDAHLFYGREAEIRELSGDIFNNTQTVVYGPSGTGKTSIIKAGIFTVARQNNFLPIYIRLSHGANENYTAQIIEKITSSVKEIGGEIDNVVKPIFDDKISLWEFFHGNEFWNKDNYPVTPLIVIDQFEEIFTLTKDKSTVREFFVELSDLCDNKMPQYLKNFLNDNDLRKEYSDKVNYRLVLTLREDFLARLEEYAVNIPSLRRNRFSLQSINEEQAMDIIMKPSKGMVSENVAIEIIKKVTNNSNFKIDGIPEITVETALLSLFCNELNKKRLDDGLPEITLDLVEKFGDNIISEYYENTMALVSEKTMLYLENSLLTKKGYRDSIALGDAFDYGVTPDEIDTLQQNRLIHVDEWDGTKRIEFTHDVLCKVAKGKRDKRYAEMKLRSEQKKIRELEKERRSFLKILVGVDLGIIGLLSFFFTKTFLDYPFDSSEIYAHIPFIPYILVTFFLLIFRVNISLLILSNEKKGLYASVLFICFVSVIICLTGKLGFGCRQLMAFFDNYILCSSWEGTKISDYFGFLIILEFLTFPVLYYMGKVFFNWKSTNNNVTWLSLVTCPKVIKNYRNIYLVQFVLLLISMTIGLKCKNVYSAIYGSPLILASFCSILMYKSANKPKVKTLIFTSIVVLALFVILVCAQFETFVFDKIYIYILIWLSFIGISFIVIKQINKKQLSLIVSKILVLFFISFFLIPIFLIGNVYFSESAYALVKKFNTSYNSQGIYLITDSKGKYGLRDRRGLIVPVEFDNIKDFDLPLLMVSKNKKWGIFNISTCQSKCKNTVPILNIISNSKLHSEECNEIPCLYKKIERLSTYQYPNIIVTTNFANNKGVFDINGKIEILPCLYKSIIPINDEFSEVLIKNSTGATGIYNLIDKVEIIKCKYDSIAKLNNEKTGQVNFYKVKLDGKYGLMAGISSASLIISCSKQDICVDKNCIKISNFNGRVDRIGINKFCNKINTEYDAMATVESVIQHLWNCSVDSTSADKEKILYCEQIIHICTQNNNLLKNDEYLFSSYVQTLGNLSWYQLFEKSFSKVEKNAILALKLDPTQTWIKTNLAHALLFQNKYKDAKKIYLELKNQPYPPKPSKTFNYYILRDFDELEKAGITHPDIAKIRELLK
ncbi:ATP-binding protein [Paludibacter sp.]|uniref:nSTAND1 domain-containing NTPase n=1 Tax=Paludibacter sp. TaxID=1898105 RepID=UPI001352992D|nr:ATP-binding protein [Paludibacter sp.]MTK53112.1 ATP-binding protein [Paludibacter sp.]